MLSLFHESIRPTVLEDGDYCEKVLVLGGFWTPNGYGSFIPEPLLADMFRATAYKYADWEYKEPEDHKLTAFLLQRGGRRKIVNLDEVYTNLISRYNSSVWL